MAEDELDLSEFEEFSKTAASGRKPDRGGGGAGKSGRRRRRWPWFVVGMVLGALGAVFLPDLAAPYLPDVLRSSGDEVRGPVLGKRLEGDRLLLTVDTDRGAVLATFRQRVSELDLLVQEGDTVTLGLAAYAPLVEEPSLEGVTKGGPGAGAAREVPGAGPDSEAGAEGEAPPPEPAAEPDTSSGGSGETAADPGAG